MPKTSKTNIHRKKKDDKAPFPSLLRELREKYSISQEEIAEKLKISRQTISDYQWGETIPDIDTASKIVDFFNEKCGLNYSIDYWLGKKEISKGIKKEEVLIPNSIVEKLQEQSDNKAFMVTLDFLLTEKDFFERLLGYFIYPYLSEVVKKDIDLTFFFEFQEKVWPSYNDENPKYRYYDILESMPRLAEKCKEQVKQVLEENNDLIFEYVEFLKKNKCSSIDAYEEVAQLLDKETEEERRKRIKEQEEEDKEFAKYYQSEANLKLLEEYEAYKKKIKEVDKDECIRTRKRKKV